MSFAIPTVEELFMNKHTFEFPNMPAEFYLGIFSFP
jgi:hypothetical protein